MAGRKPLTIDAVEEAMQPFLTSKALIQNDTAKGVAFQIGRKLEALRGFVDSQEMALENQLSGMGEAGAGQLRRLFTAITDEALAKVAEELDNTLREGVGRGNIDVASPLAEAAEESMIALSELQKAPKSRSL